MTQAVRQRRLWSWLYSDILMKSCVSGACRWVSAHSSAHRPGQLALLYDFSRPGPFEIVIAFTDQLEAHAGYHAQLAFGPVTG